MTGNFEIPGDGTAIVTFTFQANKEKVESVVEHCSLWLYKSNPGVYGKVDENDYLLPFSNLSPQDKLDILNKFVMSSVMDIAFQGKGDAAALAAIKDGTLDLGE